MTGVMKPLPPLMNSTFGRTGSDMTTLPIVWLEETTAPTWALPGSSGRSLLRRRAER
jgi:hypothetical protein